MAETLNAMNSEKLLSEHLQTLRRYAKRVVGYGGILTRDEERDKSARMAEFMAQGRSLGMSDSNIYTQIFGDMAQRAEPKCGCPTCRKRAQREGKSASDGGMTSAAA